MDLQEGTLSSENFSTSLNVSQHLGVSLAPVPSEPSGVDAV